MNWSYVGKDNFVLIVTWSFGRSGKPTDGGKDARKGESRVEDPEWRVERGRVRAAEPDLVLHEQHAVVGEEDEESGHQRIGHVLHPTLEPLVVEYFRNAGEPEVLTRGGDVNQRAKDESEGRTVRDPGGIEGFEVEVSAENVPEL